jgi:divalent metal cation (Fe/Co/Zn/Cd) transporter
VRRALVREARLPPEARARRASAVAGHEAQTSWLGIGLTIVGAALMPAFGIAKRRVGAELGSAATAAEGTQNMLCAYLSLAVLAGLPGNTLFGTWWLDPLAGLFIAYVAVREGRESWEGEECGRWPRQSASIYLRVEQREPGV